MQTSLNKNKQITDKEQLLEYFHSGCKPMSKWRIGTEHEKFAFNTKTLKPLSYEGQNVASGIRDWLLL